MGRIELGEVMWFMTDFGAACEQWEVRATYCGACTLPSFLRASYRTGERDVWLRQRQLGYSTFYAAVQGVHISRSCAPAACLTQAVHRASHLPQPCRALCWGLFNALSNKLLLSLILNLSDPIIDQVFL